MTNNALPCLTCRQYAVRTRGCCERCYHRHRQAVSAGETTWPDLEARGLTGQFLERRLRAVSFDRGELERWAADVWSLAFRRRY